MHCNRPNIDIAIKLKENEGLFEPNWVLSLIARKQVLELNGCTIEAYPSIKPYRCLPSFRQSQVHTGRRSRLFQKRKQQEADDYLQLVLGAPKPGQTKYNESKSTSKTSSSEKNDSSKKTNSQTSAASNSTDTNTKPYQSGASGIGQAVGQTFTGAQKYITGSASGLANDFLHPATGFHRGTFGPSEIEHAIIEGLKHGKVSGL